MFLVLFPRLSQRGFQPSSFLVPPGLDTLQLRLKCFDLILDCRDTCDMLIAGSVQRLLRLVDGRLPSHANFLASSFLLYACPVAARLLLLISKRCLLPGGGVTSLLCLLDRLPASGPRGALLSAAFGGKISREVGMLLEGPAGADRAFSTTPGAAIVAATMCGSTVSSRLPGETYCFQCPML